LLRDVNEYARQPDHPRTLALADSKTLKWLESPDIVATVKE
jgi:hypothetical protein